MSRLILLVAAGYAIIGCAPASQKTSEPMEPDLPTRELCDKGKYHEAMRALPSVMKQWEEYTERTGNTCEGAAGFDYCYTMCQIAIHGDADWGKILDDPDIPYEYKIEMISEILENRLGKDTTYFDDKGNMVVPRR